MLRKLIFFAIHQPLFVFMLLALFIGSGIFAYRTLPIEAFPDVTDIQVTVVTLYPGHAAEEVAPADHQADFDAGLGDLGDLFGHGGDFSGVNAKGSLSGEDFAGQLQ